MRIFKSLVVSFVVCFIAMHAQAELPEDSLYLINSPWQNQNSETLQLKDLAGKKQIISLVYTQCQHTCPVIIETMKMVERSIPKNEIDKYNFVLVSLTPETDTPEVLKAFAIKRKIDKKNWLLLQGSENDVRTLSMALETEYKAIGDGEVAHANLISILDEQGRIEYQAKGAADQAKRLIDKL